MQITNYQIEVPMQGLVDYVLIQYDADNAVSMTKAEYDTLPSNSSIPQAGE